MSYNPFDELSRELAEIKDLLLKSAPPTREDNLLQTEIIDTDTLCYRLNITEPTAIRHRKRGTIPFLQIGSAIRYNWPAVVKALENKKKSR
ncbi:hypothetical protein [Segetibacter koreensis]|uniref:hypothetical protein n=1 Tax=Segetibacter koreensis TaxID=398037 RepID=UPI00035CFF48|nr:hypothetical protein [Segetibacter koreensis]